MNYSAPEVPTVLQHLYELRKRILLSALCFVIGTAIGFLIKDTLTQFLIHPLNKPIYYMSPGGGFDFIITMCTFFGFIVSLPIVFYQILKFIEPALPTPSRHMAKSYLIGSCLLTLVGSGFAYFISLPATLRFLEGFNSANIVALLSANDYLNFIVRYLVGFSILFQLPLIFLLVNQFVRLRVKTLFKHYPTIIILSFVIAAIITPTPDIFNQVVLAVPIILLYQASMIMIWVVNKKMDYRFSVIKPSI